MTSFAGGVGHLARGFGMWRRRPGLMLLGMVPALIVFLLLLAAFLVLLWKVDDLVGWATPFADDWATTARTVLRIGLMLAVLSAAIFVSAALFVALTLAVGEPFYERIWRATEQMLGGPVPDHEIGTLRSVGDSLAFAVLMRGLWGRSAVGGVPARRRSGPGGCRWAWWCRAGCSPRSWWPARSRRAGSTGPLARRCCAATRVACSVSASPLRLFFLIPLGAILVMPAAVVGSTGLARDLLADPARTLAQPR